MSTRMSIWVVLIVAVIFTTALGIMFYYSRNAVQEEALQKGRETLENTSLYIDNTMSQVEIAADNIKWHVEQNLQHPDKMFSLSRQILSSNPYLTGCSIAFEPYYYSSKGKYFSAYSYNGRDSIQTEQEGDDSYQYHCMDWYLIPKLLDKPYWIEPFFEDAEEGIIVKDIFSSYSQPIHDPQGRVVGTFSVDIRLDWFASTISEAKPYPHSYSVLLGKGGTYLVHPDTTKLFYQTVFTQTMERQDSAITSIGEAMIAGETGHRITNINGERNYIFYKPFKNTGWSVATICPERDIFDPYNKLQRVARITMIVGLLLLLIFCLIIVNRNLQPLKHLADFTELTAEGQFTDEVPDNTRPDEIGKLQHRFYSLQQALRQYISQIHQETERLQQQNVDLAVAYEHVQEEERLKTRVLHKMSEEMVLPVQGILSQSRAICDHHDEMTEETFAQTVDDMLQDTTQVTSLLDKLMKEAQGSEEIKNEEVI